MEPGPALEPAGSADADGALNESHRRPLLDRWLGRLCRRPPPAARATTPEQHLKTLAVHDCGWGEDWPLALLADDGRTLRFEYAPEALAQGLELSPLHLKLRAAAYGSFAPRLQRLPRLVTDSLPDCAPPGC